MELKGKMESQLSVNCSPGTFSRLEEDEKYRQQVASHLLAKEDRNYDEVIFMPIESQKTNEQNTIDNEMGLKISDDKMFWSDAATKLMLATIEELRPKLGKSVHIKTKNKMYKVAAERMEAKGHIFTPTQIENKFRGLERQYKKVALNNKQTGRSRQTCSFESELTKILGQKRAIIPEFVLESGDDEGTSRSTAALEELSSDTEHSQKDDAPSCSSPVDFPSCSSSASKKRRQIGIKQQLMEKIDEMKEEKKDFHMKVLELLKKKDEREEQREKRSQKKLELLEMLVNQNKPS